MSSFQQKYYKTHEKKAGEHGAYPREWKETAPRGACASSGFLDEDFKLPVINTLEEPKGATTSKTKGKTTSHQLNINRNTVKGDWVEIMEPKCVTKMKNSIELNSWQKTHHTWRQASENERTESQQDSDACTRGPTAAGHRTPQQHGPRSQGRVKHPAELTMCQAAEQERTHRQGLRFYSMSFNHRS